MSPYIDAVVLTFGVVAGLWLAGTIFRVFRDSEWTPEKFGEVLVFTTFVAIALVRFGVVSS